MRFSVLASGSRGNAAIVEYQGFRILIDCGISVRELSRRLGPLQLSVTDIDALLVTHFHSDHIKGIPTLVDKVPVEIFARKGFEGMNLSTSWKALKALSSCEVGPFTVTPLPLPHDDGGSLGFSLLADNLRFVFATDLGEATADLCQALQEADALVLESNHCLNLLDDCAYPHFIKDRIRSEHGHLSNCQTADLLEQHVNSKCQHIVLAHLSERANNPQTALKTARKATVCPVVAASQSTATGWFEVLEDNSALKIAV